MRSSGSARAPLESWPTVGRRYGDRFQGRSVRRAVTVFVDGISENVTYFQLRKEFERFGTLYGVFLQKRKKPGRRTRFAFIRFKHDKDACEAIRSLNGVWLLQSFLVVNKARFVSESRGDVVQHKVRRQKHGSVEPKVRQNTVGEGGRKRRQQLKQVWRVKPQVQEAQDLIFQTTEEDRKRIETIAEASLDEVYTIGVLQDFLNVNGLSSIRVKPLGAMEVLLEFQTKDEMLDIIRDGFLLQKFQSITPCSLTTRSKSHATWLKVMNVPVYAWSYDFFTKLGNIFGRLVCLDGPTSARARFDVARILIVSSSPVVAAHELKVMLDGVAVKVLVKPEQTEIICPVTVRCMAASVVSVSSSEQGGEEDNCAGGKTASPTVTKKKTYKNNDEEMDQTLQHLIEAGYSTEELKELPMFKNWDWNKFESQRFNEGNKFQSCDLKKVQQSKAVVEG